jgi:hypothetical protein
MMDTQKQFAVFRQVLCIPDTIVAAAFGPEGAAWRPRLPGNIPGKLFYKRTVQLITKPGCLWLASACYHLPPTSFHPGAG